MAKDVRAGRSGLAYVWDNPGVKSSEKSELYRKLPSVDEAVRGAQFAALVARDGQASVTDAARAVLSRLREEISTGRLDETGVTLAVSGLAGAVDRELRNGLGYSLRLVINATGVILH